MKAHQQALIHPVRGKHPVFGDDNWIAPNATIVGDVRTGEGCSIWYNAVIRGDVNSIVLGDEVNIQDGAVVHCTFEKTTTQLGNRVSVGHNAIIHGCTVEDDVLIGMGAIVMDNVYIETGSVIAAGAVVLEGTRVPAGSVFAGVPARLVKKVSSALFAGEVKRISQNYRMYSSWAKAGIEEQE
ncbi:MAG: gamma carbonic anhydrase family protein [Flavobacteriales bacterium]|nr:gamma carbonic anhydrase family protein [Flavobacteriales bacterium]